ncbi:MAG TPA: hypothetical protein PLK40_01270, partial [Bacteroidaceae bacterium]|nr:hypothetical protein [Bacteroidaceae bacterium]
LFVPFMRLDSNVWSHRFKRLNRWDQTFESTLTKCIAQLLNTLTTLLDFNDKLSGFRCSTSFYRCIKETL